MATSILLQPRSIGLALSQASTRGLVRINATSRCFRFRVANAGTVYLYTLKQPNQSELLRDTSCLLRAKLTHEQNLFLNVSYLVSNQISFAHFKSMFVLLLEYASIFSTLN